MKLQLCRPLVQDFLAIAESMPVDERRQYLATTGETSFDAQNAARAMVQMPGQLHCAATMDGRPVSIGGFQRLRAGVWQGWMVGAAEDWPEYGRELTRLCRTLQQQVLERADCHRLEVLATRERTHAHHWYVDGLGMTLEGPRVKYFADGSDALVFTRFKEA